MVYCFDCKHLLVIWFARNELLFQARQPTRPSLVIQILAFSHNYYEQMLPEGNIICNPQLIKWVPPSQGTLKINCDASFLNFAGGIIFILRDGEGCCLTVASTFLEGNSVLTLEAYDVRDALKFAIVQDLPHFVIESDSRTLINVLNKTTDVPWSISTLVADILYLSTNCNLIDFSFYFREANKAVHWAANRARLCKDERIWSSIRPPELERILVTPKRPTPKQSCFLSPRSDRAKAFLRGREAHIPAAQAVRAEFTLPVHGHRATKEEVGLVFLLELEERHQRAGNPRLSSKQRRKSQSTLSKALAKSSFTRRTLSFLDLHKWMISCATMKLSRESAFAFKEGTLRVVYKLCHERFQLRSHDFRENFNDT
ncbi:hypothetical protein Cni_G14413 [Canna indica]|uniref:RNase H type-1 domain-containing protein n=1 Tax=Canna indica TaxID=4628 RepID=A0AAQ3QCD5_9LILI|nr:hypothetical protein Cni_G14413 [Canna indica]